jgi:mannosyltransferase
MLSWFVIPPVLLYGYSLASHPIFGPARYTLYVAPAYLLLVAHGLAKAPLLPRFALGVGMMVLSASLLPSFVYAPDLKANWREAAKVIREGDPDAAVLTLSDTESAMLTDTEIAGYYLDRRDNVLAASVAAARLERDPDALPETLWVAVGLRQGRPIADVPAALLDRYELASETIALPGMHLSHYRRRDPPHSDEKARAD